MTIFRRVLITFIVLMSLPSLAKDKNFRKVQEVDFSEMSLKGTIRNPDGLFLLQKKGMKFLPLYDLQKDMDKKIRNSEVLL
jgi:hypothetical protein